MKTTLMAVMLLMLAACTSTPDVVHLRRLLATYSEACSSHDVTAWKGVVSSENYAQRQRELKKKSEALTKENICPGPSIQDALKKTDGELLRIQDDYARLISYRTISIPMEDQTYKSEIGYYFFLREAGKWKVHNYVLAVDWTAVDKLRLDEAHLAEAFQMKRHEFRFMSYDFRVIASINKSELETIIRAVHEKSKDPIGSIERAPHPSDILEPWVYDGKVTDSVTRRTADPEAEDTLIDVMTSKSSEQGYGHGDSFSFEKINGEWQMKNRGFWVE